MQAVQETDKGERNDTTSQVAIEVMGWHPVWFRGVPENEGEGEIVGSCYRTQAECERNCHPDEKPVLFWADEREATFPGRDEYGWLPTEDYNCAHEVLLHLGLNNPSYEARELFLIELQLEVASRMRCIFDADQALLLAQPLEICRAALAGVRRHQEIFGELGQGAGN